MGYSQFVVHCSLRAARYQLFLSCFSSFIFRHSSFHVDAAVVVYVRGCAVPKLGFDSHDYYDLDGEAAPRKQLQPIILPTESSTTMKAAQMLQFNTTFQSFHIPTARKLLNMFSTTAVDNIVTRG